MALTVLKLLLLAASAVGLIVTGVGMVVGLRGRDSQPRLVDHVPFMFAASVITGAGAGFVNAIE